MVSTVPSISIITVNYNQLEVTCELLNSLRKLQFKDYEVFVVDNASTVSPKQHLNSHYPEVQVIESSKNLGFAGGNNLAVRECKGDYIFFVNNDTELIEGCIEQLLAMFDKIPNLGIVSPLICYFPSEENQFKDIIQYAGTTTVSNFTARNTTIGEMELDKGQYTKAEPTAYVHGAAMMIPRSVVEKTGMMAEDYFLYYEELDWCEQIRNAGFKIYVEPNAKIYHKESISVGKMSTLKTYYLNRNRILFMRRHRSPINVFFFSLFLLFFTIPKNVGLHILKGEFAHAKTFLKAVWWNISQPSKKKIIKNVLPARQTSYSTSK